MNYWGPICVLLCLTVLTFYYRRKLFDRGEVVYTRGWLIGWMIRAVWFPTLLWIVINSGSSPMLPAVNPMPQPDAKADAKIMARMARIAGPLVPPPAPPPPPTRWQRFKSGTVYVATQTGTTLVALSSYWSALTFGWWVVAAARRMEDRAAFLNACAGWGLLLLPIAGLIIYLYGPGGVGFALLVWFCPLVHYASALLEKPAPVPIYGGAIASIKMGKYRQAETAIIGELEKCDTDFDGWLMLAELYATKFGDLGEAERTLRELCADPKTTLPQVAIALHKLADLHLQLRGDPAAARRALDEITRLMPGTHLARMAALRASQIPATTAAWEKQQKRGHTVRVPVRKDVVPDGAGGDLPPLSESEATRRAGLCVEQLGRDPNDVPAREELARILAEQLQQFAPAIEQLDLLLNMPDQPEAKQVEWLALMAEWEVRAGQTEAALNLLRRIIHEHRQSAQAFAAQRRLNLLELEMKMQKAAVPPASRNP